MKKLFKKWYFWIIVVVLIGIVILFSGGNDSNNETTLNESANAIKTTSSQTEINGYQCEILSAELGKKTYDNKPTIIITYKFTNNSLNSSSFYTAFNDTVYQNGVECERSYNLEETNEDKSIKPGASLEVKLDYTLNDTTTDVEVELTDWLSWDNTVISKTFKIA